MTEDSQVEKIVVTDERVAARLVALRWLYEESDELAKNHATAREAAIPRKVREKLAAIDAEYAAEARKIAAGIEEVETDIKTGVISLGHTVKGINLMAVYTPPKVTWDTGWLDGYGAAHPEILTARKTGKPSVAIRKA